MDEVVLTAPPMFSRSHSDMPFIFGSSLCLPLIIQKLQVLHCPGTAAELLIYQVTVKS